jgi:hypothetical protein
LGTIRVRAAVEVDSALNVLALKIRPAELILSRSRAGALAVVAAVAEAIAF